VPFRNVVRYCIIRTGHLSRKALVCSFVGFSFIQHIAVRVQLMRAFDMAISSLGIANSSTTLAAIVFVPALGRVSCASALPKTKLSNLVEYV